MFNGEEVKHVILALILTIDQRSNGYKVMSTHTPFFRCTMGYDAMFYTNISTTFEKKWREDIEKTHFWVLLYLFS